VLLRMCKAHGETGWMCGLTAVKTSGLARQRWKRKHWKRSSGIAIFGPRVWARVGELFYFKSI